jgi:hypothetical protein
MTLREVFATGGITRAHIIDDAYDAIPSAGIDPGVASRFVNELDDAGFDRACTIIGLANAKEDDFVAALRDPLHTQALFSARAQFGEQSDILFGEFLRDRTSKQGDLEPLIKLLEEHGVECHKFGVAYPVTTVNEPQLVFIDLRLHEDGSPISVDAAVTMFKKLKEHHQGCQPFVFLMSTLVDALKQRREEFRVQAKLFASQFEALEKRLFGDVNELSYVLARYARVLPQLRSLQKSIEDVGTAVHTAVSRVQDELKNLDLADYFVLHRNTISIEKVELGTYISDLVLEYLAHEVENTTQIWDFARELDKLRPENLPRSRFALTPAAGKIYSGNLIHASGRLEAERERNLGPSDGYFYLGDIYFAAKELNDPVPKTALVIATPACDLVRPEVLKKRTIFLCEGKVQLMSVSSVPAGHDRLPGVILPHPTDPKKQLLINWDKKKLHTWHAAQMDEFKNIEACHWVRVGRLRPLYAIQLQHAITADLSRIGVQRAPNMLVPHGVEVLIKKDGKWTMLDNVDAADATAAAFSESEDRSRTVYVFADTTVSRVRRKLREWITRNGAKAPAAAPLEAPVTAGANLAQPAAIEQVKPAVETNTSDSARESLTAAAAASLLDKLLQTSDFDQKLMYTEFEAPDDENELPANCAFPYAGHGDLTKEEGQTFVIIRPGKQSLYQSVAGGQTATAEQTATVLFKLVKVKEPQAVAKPSAKKAVSGSAVQHAAPVVVDGQTAPGSDGKK